jgi:hypothetical protein
MLYSGEDEESFLSNVEVNVFVYFMGHKCTEIPS